MVPSESDLQWAFQLMVLVSRFRQSWWQMSPSVLKALRMSLSCPRGMMYCTPSMTHTLAYIHSLAVMVLAYQLRQRVQNSAKPKAQNKWCRIAICYPNFRNCYTKPTPDLQFATQNYTQTNKKCEELLYKIIFFDCVVWKISKIAMHRKKVILSPETQNWDCSSPFSQSFL
jgi:hypothetical protein